MPKVRMLSISRYVQAALQRAIYEPDERGMSSEEVETTVQTLNETFWYNHPCKPTKDSRGQKAAWSI